MLYMELLRANCCDTSRSRRNAVRNHKQFACSSFDSRGHVEIRGYGRAAGCYPHRAVIVSFGVKHMSGTVIHDLHERVIRRVLKVIAVSARLRQAIELRSRNRIRVPSYECCGYGCDGWLPGRVESSCRGKELYIGGIVRIHNLSVGQDQEVSLKRSSIDGVRWR